MKFSLHKINAIFFPFALMLVLFGSDAAVDTLKKKLEIRDPLDPDCPCYRYQKKAVREFRKANRKANNKRNLEIHKGALRKIKLDFNSPNQLGQKKLSRKTKRRSGAGQKIHRARIFKFDWKESINSCPKW